MRRNITRVGGLCLYGIGCVLIAGAMTLQPGCATTNNKMAEDCTECEEIAGIAGEFRGWSHYGMEVTVDREPGCPGSLINANKEGPVVVAGDITEVCEMKGCWMMLGEGEHTVRVTFKDYSFFVPKNASGHRALIVGKAEFVERDVDTLRHFAEDQGKSEEEIAAITEPQRVIEIVADSVYIEGDDLEEPHKQ